MSEVDLPRRLRRYGGTNYTIHRVVVTAEDIATFGETMGFDPKLKGQTGNYFRTHYGTRAMELDALDPRAVRRRVEEKIRSLIDLDEFAKAGARTEKMLLALPPALRRLLRSRAGSGRAPCARNHNVARHGARRR